MSSRRSFISAVICAAASYGAYYEQARYNPSSEAAKAGAVYEQMARGDAADALKRCQEESSSDDACSQTYGETLRSARSWYGEHGQAYNVVQDTHTRNLYLFVAVISGFVAFFQLRKKNRGSNGASSGSRRVTAPAEVHPPSTSRSRATDQPQHSLVSPQVPPTDDSKLVAPEGLWPATAPPRTHPQEHATSSPSTPEDVNPAVAVAASEPPPGPSAQETPAASKPTPDVAPPMSTEAAYRALVGPKNAAFYLRAFAQRDRRGTTLSWHWPAFFVPILWALYRKCWAAAALALVYAAVSLWLIGTIVTVVGNVFGLGLTGRYSLSAVLAFAVIGGVTGSLANTFYHRKAQALIADARLQPTERERRVWLVHHGGTSLLWSLIVGGISLFFTLVLIMAAYQDQRELEERRRAAVAEAQPMPEPPPAHIAPAPLQANEPTVASVNASDAPSSSPVPSAGQEINRQLNLMLEQGDHAGAKRLARDLFAEDKRWHSYAHNALGLIANAGGSPSLAKREFQQALALDPGQPALLFNLGSAHEAAGEEETALRLYKEAVAAKPGYERARTGVARLQGKVEAARKDQAWEDYKARHPLPDCAEAATITGVAECLRERSELRQRLGS